MAVRQVISRGYARWATKIEVEENNTVTVTYDVRQLARNSGGSPIRANGSDNGGSAGNDVNVVADYMAWVDLESGQSSVTRQRAIDALDATYNDGRVITSNARTDGVYDDDIPLYQAPADDDNDDSTDAANDDSNAADPDPILVFARASKVDMQALRGILNDHALDTYLDRGEAYDLMTDVMRRAVDAALIVPSTMDHEGAGDGSGEAVQVVDEAVSRNVGDEVLNITHVLADDNQFLTDDQDDEEGETPELVYTYDDDDIFIDSTEDEGQEIDMETFESKINYHDDDDKDPVDIQVIAYDIDGTSIFRVVDDS
jgi:hypothetical protein